MELMELKELMELMELMLDIWPVDLEQWSESALYYMWKHLDTM